MFNTNFSLYVIMLIISLISNVIVVLCIYKKYNLTTDETIGALVYENIGIIFGAKVLTYLENTNLYKNFDFLNIGFTSYGALLGAFICLFIFKIQFKKKAKDIYYTFLPSIPLMYAIGKIGCFLVGCCYGMKYSGPGSIIYNYSNIAPKNISLFPVQILETLIFTLIFIYTIKKTIKNKFNNKELGIFIILCGTSKFLLDFLRMKTTSNIFSTNQLLSLVFIFIGIFIFIKYLKEEND